LAPEPAACIMVGMGGFFAGVAKVPFASVIMVMEMTGSYGLLVPSLLVATIAYLVTPASAKLYENQVPSRIDSPAHLGAFAVDILRRACIKEHWTPKEKLHVVRQDTSLRELMRLAAEESHDLLPVVDGAGLLVGDVTIEDIRRALIAETPQDLVLAHDLMRPPVGPLVPDDTLATAARLLAQRRTDAIAVVQSHDRKKPIGLFTRHDLIVAYGQRIGEGAAGESGPS
jgi:CIC family chloride channel protein